MSTYDIRAARESLGLSRGELAAEAGVTIGALASVESGRGSRDKAAEEKVRRALAARITPTTRTDDQRGTPRAFRNVVRVPARREGFEYIEEWNGLTPEARFTVLGEEGVFSFIRFVRSPKGSEWVDAIGGERGYPPAFRSFIPERVQPFT